MPDCYQNLNICLLLLLLLPQNCGIFQDHVYLPSNFIATIMYGTSRPCYLIKGNKRYFVLASVALKIEGGLIKHFRFNFLDSKFIVIKKVHFFLKKTKTNRGIFWRFKSSKVILLLGTLVRSCNHHMVVEVFSEEKVQRVCFSKKKKKASKWNRNHLNVVFPTLCENYK